MSNKTIRTGIQKATYRKHYKINAGASSYKVEFTEANRQFDYLEMSLVCGKSDPHKFFFDSYNLELASTLKKNVLLENA